MSSLREISNAIVDTDINFNWVTDPVVGESLGGGLMILGFVAVGWFAIGIITALIRIPENRRRKQRETERLRQEMAKYHERQKQSEYAKLHWEEHNLYFALNLSHDPEVSGPARIKLADIQARRADLDRKYSTAN